MNETTILLVDDDAVLSQVLRRVLTRQGYRVVEAGTVADAVRLAHDDHPNLGLVDLCLPDGDGVELARTLAQEGRSVPLILMTAYPLRLRDQPELADGFARVLTKPLNLEELRNTIEQVLTGAAAASPPPVASQSSSTSLPRVAPGPAPAPEPPAPVPSSPRPRRWALAAVGVLVAAAGGLGAWWAAGKPNLWQWFQKKPEETRVATGPGVPVPNDPNGLELPADVLANLHIRGAGDGIAIVSDVVAPRPLVLAGSLSFDPTKLFRIQSRFGGEVIRLGETDDREEGQTRRRQLRPGDYVKKGDLLAVVLSKDLGEKKSDLIDKLVKLQVDTENLIKIKDLYERGITPEVVYRQQHALVANGTNAAASAERTLRTWQVSEADIEAVKAEARRVGNLQQQRDIAKEAKWAEVEVRAPSDGVIAEMNVNLHNIVDTTFDLYKIADLSSLGVLLNAYEEDLRPVLQLLQAPPPRRWLLTIPAEPNLKVDDEGIERLGYIVDPNQHTTPVFGRVDNTAHWKIRPEDLASWPKRGVPEAVVKKLAPLANRKFDEEKKLRRELDQLLAPEERQQYADRILQDSYYEGGKLRVGQFITATVPLPAPKNVVSVPASALYEDGEESSVFLQPSADRPNVLTLRRVLVVGRLGTEVYVASKLSAAQQARGLRPLEPGERIVTQSVVELRATLEDVQGQAKEQGK
jgi:cobalt-zinc-cadmium efflux system membrane fusion protein